MFNKQIEIEKYSHMVSVTEIEANDINLNISCYIDSQEAEDIQDIEAHLRGDIPIADIDAMYQYWEVYPSLKKVLFNPSRRARYSQLAIHYSQLKDAIFSHPEFTDYSKKVGTVFSQWKIKNMLKLKGIAPGDKPKKLIHEISEDLLEAFSNVKLVDKYDVYQHLMVYWYETMQDDVYTIVSDGWDSRVLPKRLIIARYFETEQKASENLETYREAIARQLEEIEEGHSGEEGLMADAKNDKDKITKASVQKRIKEINCELKMVNGELTKDIGDTLPFKGRDRVGMGLSPDEEELTLLKQC